MTRWQFALSELTIVLLSCAFIVLTYYAVLPFFFPGTATSSVLITGVVFSAISSALVAKAYGLGAGRFAWTACWGVGVAVGVLVLFLSLGFVVSLMGS